MARKFTDALDQPITQPADITLPASGSIEGVRDTVIEPVGDLSNFTSKAEALKFNEELLDVIIAEASDGATNPEPYVYLAVNGRGPMPNGEPWVPRGVPVKMARKYVERLCRAKPVAIRTVEAKDFDGSMTMKIKRSAALKYPFTVMSDPNPRGAQWLRDLMAQA